MDKNKLIKFLLQYKIQYKTKTAFIRCCCYQLSIGKNI